MKRLLGSFFLMVALFIFQHDAMAIELSKIGILNIQRCIAESNEGKRISEALKNEIESMQERYNKAKDELNELQQEIEKQSLMLSLDAKENKQKEYEIKERELNYLAQDLNEEANKAQENARLKILQELDVIIRDVAKQGNFELVFEKSSSGILYSSESLDITNQVIREFNKAKP